MRRKNGPAAEQSRSSSRGRCRDCLREYERERRQRRGSTAQRGYGRAWQELRKVAACATAVLRSLRSDRGPDCRPHRPPRSRRTRRVVEPANPLPILQRDQGGEVKGGPLVRSDDRARTAAGCLKRRLFGITWERGKPGRAPYDLICGSRGRLSARGRRIGDAPALVRGSLFRAGVPAAVGERGRADF